MNGVEPTQTGEGGRRVLLILPCYNEASSLGALLEEIKAIGGYDTLVIDDFSSDGTADVARVHGVLCVRLVKNLGIGGAVQTGIKYAFAHGYDFCVQIDGDGQHPPADVAHLLTAHTARPTSIIVGSRYQTGEGFRPSWARRVGSRVIAQSLRLFFGTTSTDPTSGMRLMDRKAIAFFARAYPHDFPEPISLAWAVRAGLTVSEAPVRMRERAHGESSITGLKPLAYMLRVLGYIILVRLHMLIRLHRNAAM